MMKPPWKTSMQIDYLSVQKMLRTKIICENFAQKDVEKWSENKGKRFDFGKKLLFFLVFVSLLTNRMFRLVCGRDYFLEFFLVNPLVLMSFRVKFPGLFMVDGRCDIASVCKDVIELRFLGHYLGNILGLMVVWWCLCLMQMRGRVHLKCYF